MKPPDDLCLFGIRSTIVNPLHAVSGKVAWFVLILSSMVLGASGQTLTWTDSFTEGQPSTEAQCQNWNNFRASLALKNFASVTISGTFDEVGKTLSNPTAATELAQRLSSATVGTVTFEGQSWTVGTCGGAVCGGASVTLSVDGSTSACNCDDKYAIKPGNIGSQWGGVNTASCNGPSQTMRLIFHSGVSITANGPTTICPGGNVVLTANTEICTGPYTYLWSNGATTESITVTQAGDYSVAVTSLDGCSGISPSTAVSVSEISVDAGVAATFCDEPVQLNATGTSENTSGTTVNTYCMFDAPGGAGGCTFPEGEDVCTGALFYTSGSFSTTISVANPVTLRYNVYYSAFSENTSFILKLNDQEIGSFTENPFEATGACDTRSEGKFPRTFTFAEPEFFGYWYPGADNILTVEVVSGIPGIYLAGISVEVVSSNESYSWTPAEGLSNPSIANPLASPFVTTLYAVTYTDGKGCTATDQVEVVVNCNTAPVAVCTPLVVEAGANCEAMVEAVTFDGGSTSNTGGQLNFSVSPAGPYAIGETDVTLTVTDSNGQSSTCTTTITVNDTTAPLISAADLVVVNDEGACSAILALSEPETSDNCGVETISNDQADDIFPVGETMVTWTVTDVHGNEQTTTQKITVTNNDPVINSVTASGSTVQINAPVTLTVSYTDNNIQSASIDWGDLSTPDVIESPSDIFDVSHSYANAGTYAVTISLTDQCEATASYVYESIIVIEKRAGSVKGSGWFNSLPGYYLNDNRAAGKAQFEFDAQYRNNGDVLAGNAAFKFKAGRIQFRSNDFELLLIDGQNAFLTGRGKLNGRGGYGILISMVDTGKKGDGHHEDGDDRDALRAGDSDRRGSKYEKKSDRIRVKIWDAEGSVVYDTQLGSADDAVATTALGGGDIKINSGDHGFGELFEDVFASNFGEGSTSVYPNPFADWVEIRFAPSSSENINVQLMDLTGRVVYSAQLPVSEDGSYSLYIPEHENSKGIFILRITQGRRVEFVRMVRE
ncbi:MAG: T9SS type A sorting domain-containing protein [Cyclobacteriaceae bacterium]